jgi:hypothetical protein
MAGEGASAEWLAGIDGYDLVLLDLPLGMAPVIPAGACWWSMRMPTAMCGFTATPGRPMSVCW